MKSFFICLGMMTLSLVASAHPTNPGAIHLAFAKAGLHAHATWIQGPQSPDESQLQIEWKNASDHTPAEPGSFKVSLVMPAMGHGSAPTQIQRVLDSQGQPLVGVFKVLNMYFTMGGDWDVNVTLKFTDGSQESQTFSVQLDDEGSHSH